MTHTIGEVIPVLEGHWGQGYYYCPTGPQEGGFCVMGAIAEAWHHDAEKADWLYNLTLDELWRHIDATDIDVDLDEIKAEREVVKRLAQFLTERAPEGPEHDEMEANISMGLWHDAIVYWNDDVASTEEEVIEALQAFAEQEKSRT